MNVTKTILGLMNCMDEKSRGDEEQERHGCSFSELLLGQVLRRSGQV